jgi:hypothetical protein
MAASASALTGSIADMAALEAAFQSSWKSLDVMSGARRPNLILTTNLAAGESLRLFVRSSSHSGTPIWSQHEDGAYTIPAKFTGAADEWTMTSYQIFGEWSGFVVHATAAATVILSTSDNQ